MKNLIRILLVLITIPVSAQEFNSSVSKSIIILLSTKNYSIAKKVAMDAGRKLKKEVRIGGLTPNPKTGLTMSRTDCETYGYPCYIARGEGDAANSNYISVEYSSAYEGFAKGYYIVVAGIGEPNTEEFAIELQKIRNVYKNAYAKKTRVWFGCLH